MRNSRLGRGAAPRRVASLATLTVVVAGVCAASGPPVTARSGMPARVAVTRASAEPAVDPGLYRECDTPSDWVGTSHPLFPAAAYLAGWSDARKLNDSLPVGFPEPALAASAGTDEGKQAGALSVPPNTYVCSRVLLQLDYHGLRELPPARATFLAYGYMPVTATVQFVQPGPRQFSACLEPGGTTSPQCPPVSAVIIDHTAGPGAPYNSYQVVSTARLSLLISDVAVNGTPLDVGSSCHTGAVTTPGNPIGYDGVVLAGGDLTGDPEPQYSAVIYGGALDGSVYVPPVSDCGANGDLDPLLTSAMSGPGNYVKLTQALLCTNGSIVGACATDGKTPTTGPLWTVTNGGAYTGTGTAQFNLSGVAYGLGDGIVCSGSAVSGTIPDSAGPPRGSLGTIQLTFADCAGHGRDGLPDGSTWTVTQQGVGDVDGVESGAIIGNPGAVAVKLSQISLTFRGWGGGTGGTQQNPCQAVLTGGSPVTYANPAGSSPPVLAATHSGAGSIQMNMASNTCSDVTLPPNAPGGSVAATYTLRTGSGITIANVPPPGS